MSDERKKVLPRMSLLTESLLKTLVAQSVSKLQHQHNLTDKEMAELLFCDPGTIANARNRETKLQAQTLFNLISIDTMAVDGLLQHFGRRSVPIEAKCDTDELITTSSAVHKLAVAKSPDSCGGVKISDTECLDMEVEIDAALESLSALKQRCLEIRKERAA